MQAELLAVLGAPRADAALVETRCAAAPLPEQVADLLWDEAGFVWLDGGSGAHWFFRRPLAGIVSEGGSVRVWGPGGAVALQDTSLDVLQAALRLWGGAPGAMLAGWVGYETASELERIAFAPGGDDLPRMYWGLYDSALRCDAGGRWSIVASDAWREADLSAWQMVLDRASGRVLAPPVSISVSEVGQNDDGFAAGVARIVERIYAGDLFQTNLCRRLEASLSPELVWPLYRKMRASSQASHGAFVQLGGGRTVLSMSPETFLEMKDGLVASLPIKGTRRRGADADEDALLREELRGSAKDRAELAMVVDVTRNDLSRVCDARSVRVTEHAAMLTLPTVHHTYSRVEGRLRAGVDAADVLRATFPPASITGAPKIAAMEAAFREERENRGVCMGSIGRISLTGEMELSVAIRTAYTANGRVVYLAGCGLTADSEPLRELDESRAKAAAFLAALR